MSPDELEASSIKYNTARIVRLTSGNYALFAPWSNAEGMPIVTIGSLSDLADYIPTADEIVEWCNSFADDRATYDEAKAKSLLETLGLVKPKPTITRRI